MVPIWKSPFGAQTYWLPAIAVLGGMGLLILLVVCANVANLVLVRGVSRRGELGVRLALGASRSRLLRLLFVENMVLVSGEVPRTTSFEHGLPPQWTRRNGHWEHDPLTRDDQCAIVRVKDKGLVIVTGCGHAGVVNIVRQARA